MAAIDIYASGYAHVARPGRDQGTKVPAVVRDRDSPAQARAHLGDEQLERAYAQDMALSLGRVGKQLSAMAWPPARPSRRRGPRPG
jgi:hypothetical protein